MPPIKFQFNLTHDFEAVEDFIDGCHGRHLGISEHNDFIPGVIQASMSKIQGLLKASPTVFKDLKVNEKY